MVDLCCSEIDERFIPTEERSQMLSTSGPRYGVLTALSIPVVVALIWTTNFGGSGKTIQLVAPQDTGSDAVGTKDERPKVDWKRLAEPHFAAAEEATKKAIEEFVAAINELFREAKNGCRPFAEEALGWRSTFRLIWDRMPWTDSDGHRKFIDSKFAEHVIEREKFSKGIQSAGKNFAAQLESIENKMLVDLRADIEQLPKHQRVVLNLDEVTSLINKNARVAEEKARLEAVKTVGHFALVEFVERLVTRQLVRSGILSALGVSSSAPSLGLSIVIGLLVDQVISYIWSWFDDPVADLSQKIERELEKVRQQVVEDSGGLREQLQRISQERAKIRREVVLQSLREASRGHR
jgi:hypothetical protein